MSKCRKLSEEMVVGGAPLLEKDEVLRPFFTHDHRPGREELHLIVTFVFSFFIIITTTYAPRYLT